MDYQSDTLLDKTTSHQGGCWFPSCSGGLDLIWNQSADGRVAPSLQVDASFRL